MAKWESIKELGRELRKRQTPSEERLWQELRNKKLNGFKFLRQHPVIYDQKGKEMFFFIADFYCAKRKVVIELDGKVHDFQKRYDYNRDLVLKELGLNVLHIKNEELENMEAVKRKILAYLK